MENACMEILLIGSQSQIMAAKMPAAWLGTHAFASAEAAAAAISPSHAPAAVGILCELKV
jgi:hypothetical protein